MKLKTLSVLAIVALTIIVSCAMPKSFLQVIDPNWSTIEIRQGLTYDQSWDEVVDVIAKKFEMEMVSKDGGYVRTAWSHTWWKRGELTENYRVRAIVKFNANKRGVDIKTEAQYLRHSQWIQGTDTRLLQTIKTDIMGVVGRTTR